MRGTTPAGVGVAKNRPDADRFKGLLPDEEARSLRRQLLANLVDGGYTKEQLAQITGWSPRTIRRDLQDRPGSVPIARHPRPVPADLTFEEEIDHLWHGAPELTAREVRELAADYGPDTVIGSIHPEVGDFLSSIQRAG